jgi:3'(2'), 5'-bisphosphate nucleotidase
MRDTLPELKVQVREDLIQEVIQISRKAGDAIMEVYKTNFDIQLKDDFSPVTMADKEANIIIENGLNTLDHTIPILSEEGRNISYEERKEWNKFWLVDPLDGTKDFIKKNGEFTVNIALIQDQAPVFGVVYAPAIDLLFWGSLENGAWKKEAHNRAQVIKVATNMDGSVQIAASRSHPSDQMNAFLVQFLKDLFSIRWQSTFISTLRSYHGMGYRCRPCCIKVCWRGNYKAWIRYSIAI